MIDYPYPPMQPFTHNFPRADIYELLSPDLLHQIIKGVFKDHLISWVEKYLSAVYGPKGAKQHLSDIDRRFVAGLPQFQYSVMLATFQKKDCIVSTISRVTTIQNWPQFQTVDWQRLKGPYEGIWLKTPLEIRSHRCQVYISAIEGHVRPEIVSVFSAYLDFCYLVRRSRIDEDHLAAIESALDRFHGHRKIFQKHGVVENFSLPRQHSMVHYVESIALFGAPNGLCSSITETRHISAVKKPWRRSSRFNALAQVLVTNQRLEKLSACRQDFTRRGMLSENPYAEVRRELSRLPVPDPDGTQGADPPAGVLNHVVLAKSKGALIVLGGSR